MKNILVTTALSSFITQLLISINKITFMLSQFIYLCLCVSLLLLLCWRSIKSHSLVHVQLLDSSPDYLNFYSFFPRIFSTPQNSDEIHRTNQLFTRLTNSAPTEWLDGPKRGIQWIWILNDNKNVALSLI